MNTGMEFLSFDRVAIRVGETKRFANLNWTWKQGEQWAILGAENSGKSLLVQALQGQVPVAAGEIRGPFDSNADKEFDPSDVIAVVSPETQRRTVQAASSFYQSRWHSEPEGAQTVGHFLSQANVERRNPYEVGALQGDSSSFRRERRQYLDWLGVHHLRRRQIAHLSSGELRKILLVEALLRKPRLLILEEWSAGLDVRTRALFKRIVARLMDENWRVLCVTQRVEEIPTRSTHVLILDQFKIVAQGRRRDLNKLWKARLALDGSWLRPIPSARAQPRSAPSHRRPSEPLVELRNVTITGVRHPILRDVSWTLRQGERWALLGPNGAGKTTLLGLIQGDHPQAYSQNILLFGRGMESTQALWEARQRLGWLSPELHCQYPAGWKAVDVVVSGYFNSIGLHQAYSRRQRAAALAWLRILGLAGNARTPFGELSFGQQRLALLARAVVKQPRLLILDEPCQSLDALQRARVLRAVEDVVARSDCSLVFVTHHEAEMPRCVTHVLRLAEGQIRQSVKRG